MVVYRRQVLYSTVQRALESCILGVLFSMRKAARWLAWLSISFQCIQNYGLHFLFIRMNCLVHSVTLLFIISQMKADVSRKENADSLTHGLLNNGEGHLYPFPAKCSEILDSFAEYSANFTMCSIKYARPIRLCSKCIDNYMKFYEKYQELLETEVNGTSCRSIFISHDRLDAVLQYYDNILDVWEQGNCNSCYDWSGTSPVLSNTTKRFNKMYNDTMDCIITNLNPAQNNSEKVCENCMQSYINLDEYYKSLSIDSIGMGTVCMDIVDSMNATRSIWSKSLNCCKLRKSPEVVFLCSTAVISLLPLLYYLVVRFGGPIRDLPNVLKQSRFKQTIMSSVMRSDDTTIMEDTDEVR